MDRRSFLEAMAVAAAAGLPLSSRGALAADGKAVYDIPRFGNVSRVCRYIYMLMLPRIARARSLLGMRTTSTCTCLPSAAAKRMA